MVIEKPWPDCGCPLSINFKPANYDRVPFPHSCGISKDEYHRHYICDHEVYLTLSVSEINTTTGQWVAKRLKEGRLFVIRGPPRPKPKKKVPAWKVEEIDMNAVELAPGWKGWTPELAEYIVDKRNIDDLFAWLGVVERWRLDEMKGTGLGFLLACGFMPKMDTQMLYKCDRVFVTASHDFYQCLMKMWMKINHFLYEVELGPGHIGPRMGHIKRLSDIESDARVITAVVLEKPWQDCGHSVTVSACVWVYAIVDKQILYKCNRVIVTVSHDFYQCVMKMWTKTNHFLYEIDLGSSRMGLRMRHFKRFRGFKSEAQIVSSGYGQF